MENYIENKKKLCCTILEFLENSEADYEDENHFQILAELVKSQKIEGDNNEMQHFLKIINNISNNHHREFNFINKIEKILQYYKDQIKQTLSNIEIFRIFESNKIILLFLLENETIIISDTIYEVIINKIESNNLCFCYFFYPEIKNYVGEEEIIDIKEELLLINPNILENYDEKRKKGENDSYICTLIRQDLVEEFISYVNRTNISLSSQINPSIFETNSFLIENKNTSLIEYSAFFGSIQIFRYLLMNNVELMPSLWLYAIHSKNAELIHLLESIIDNNSNENDNYLKCYIESIKCHHNDIADYINNSYDLCKKEDKFQQQEKIISTALKYHNYAYFQEDTILKNGFFYLCSFNYNKLVKFLFNKKKEELNVNLKKFVNNLF